MKKAAVVVAAFFLALCVRAAALPVSGTAFHVDASAASTLTLVEVNGTNFVSRWNDASGGSVYASQDTAGFRPWLDYEDGLPFVDFGPGRYAQREPSNYLPTGYLSWSADITTVREVFLVYSDYPEKSGSFLLSHSGGIYQFHRGGKGLFNTQYSDAKIQNGVIEVDGESVAPTYELPEGFHIIHLRTTGNVSANRFASDRDQYQQGAQRLREVIVYDHALSDTDAASVYDYLYCKWMAPPDDMLYVIGTPFEYSLGGLPAYGITSGHSNGESITLTAPAAITNNGVVATCKGWRRYEYDANNGVWVQVASSSAANLLDASFTFGNVASKVEWQWIVKVTCTYDGGWDNIPTSADDDIVIISGNLEWKSPLPATVSSWTQSGGTVTFATTYDPLPAGVNNVTSLPFVEVTGNVNFSAGTWTHKAQGGYNRTGSRIYRLYVKCGGSFTLGADAEISAKSKGYSSSFSNGNSQGGAYGGYSSNCSAAPYGSLFAPEEPGEGAKYGGQYPGAGAIRLEIAGRFTNNGIVQANSSGDTSYCSGAAGSVYVIAGSIEGTGLLQADAHRGGGMARGSGGRVAVILTGDGSDFSMYDIAGLASCTNGYKDATSGACGTIYAETKADGANRGWLILKGNGREPTNDDRYLANPFSSEVTEIHPSRLTITNATRLAVYPGFTMDLTDTLIECAADCGIVFRGGTVKCTDGKSLNFEMPLRVMAASTVDAAACYLTNNVVTVNRTLSFTGNLEAGSNVTFKTSGSANVPSNFVGLDVGGDMNFSEFAKIDVSSQGYSGTYYPGGQNTSAAKGGSHGGFGNGGFTASESFLEPYGSVIDPASWGSGSFQAPGYCQPGGGLVILNVGGALALNGDILANSPVYSGLARYAAAGGAVNITAGTISGTGSISAHPLANGGAGGGRVALKLTAADADFADFSGTVNVSGGGAANARGGAGTYFKKTGNQTIAEGTLIADNGTGTTASSSTLLGGVNMEGTEFGSIIVTNAAKLKFAAGSTITVNGDLINTASTVAEAGSTVVIGGQGVTTISGNWNFANLNCATPGKVIRVTPGSVITVSENIVFAGEDSSCITIECTDGESQWQLVANGASVAMSDVRIGGCNSDSDVIVSNGEDLGNNSANVIVRNIVAGNIVWTGSVSGGWGEPGNWDLERTPIKGDSVFIEAGANIPVLAADTVVAALTVRAGGELNLSDKTLTVTGDLSVQGTLTTAASQPIYVGGNATVSGSFNAGFSTLVMNGTAPGILASSEATFYAVEIENPSIELRGTLNAHSFSVGNGVDSREIVFADGAKLVASNFSVNGDSTQPNVTLRPRTPGHFWELIANQSSVSGAVVSGSDASKGVAVVPEKDSSVGIGENPNWFFSDTRIHWNGSKSAAFEDAGNWDGGLVPGADDFAVIEGVTTVTVSQETSVGALTLGLGATVTVSAPLSVAESLVVESQGTLIADSIVTVSGNLTVLDGGIITHTANSDAETYRLFLTVAGSGYIAEGAAIDVSGKGYYARRGPTTPDHHSPSGGSYGGRSSGNYNTYGSLINPVNIGAGPASNWGGNGGGAAILSFGGKLTVDGAILANGSYAQCSGAGGTVNLTAGSLVGTGVIHANGGETSGNDCGAGGRIRIKLTSAGAVLDNFHGDIGAYGGLQGLYVRQSAGTLYCETAADISGRGTLMIVNAVNTSRTASTDKTDFPKTLDNNPGECRLVSVKVASYGTLNLTSDAVISDLTVETNGRVLLNGHTLRINQPKPKGWTMPSYVTPGTDGDGNPGQITWMAGTVLILR